MKNTTPCFASLPLQHIPISPTEKQLLSVLMESNLDLLLAQLGSFNISGGCSRVLYIFICVRTQHGTSKLPGIKKIAHQTCHWLLLI